MACPASPHVLPTFPGPVPVDARLLSKPSPHLLPPSCAPSPRGPLGLERTGSSLELFCSPWEFKAPFTGGPGGSCDSSFSSSISVFTPARCLWKASSLELSWVQQTAVKTQSKLCVGPLQMAQEVPDEECGGH
ncbi:hypothetical protein MC885_002905 [Smutsia gigantea]|nr:hypothetical protein MC885_002905 [Smutsia gigantea]